MIELVVTTAEVFEHVDGRIFNITKLRRHLAETEVEVKLSAMPLENVRMMLDHHEWDDNKEERVASLLERISDEMEVPPLLCATPEKPVEGMTIDLVDGWHTLVIMFRAAQKFNLDLVKFPAHWVKWSDVARFEIPKELVRNMRMPPAGRREVNK